MAEPRHGLATLSFATGSRGAAKICLWAAANNTSSYECNREGRRRADELLAYMDVNRVPFLLGHVMEAMIAGGAYGPLETGFCQRLAERALAAEMPQPVPQRPKLEIVSSK